MKHRKVLANAAIRSIAKGRFEMSELGAGMDDDARSGYTDRHNQRLIHERYGDAFLELEVGREQSDGRARPLSTVFTKSKLPQSRDADMARAYLDAGDAVALQKRRRAKTTSPQLHPPTGLPAVSKRHAGAQGRVQDHIREPRGERRSDRLSAGALAASWSRGRALLDVFYSQLSSILDVVWFRALPEDEQKPFLRPAAKAKYGPGDARRAGAMLSGIYGRDKARDLLDYCGSAFSALWQTHGTPP